MSADLVNPSFTAGTPSNPQQEQYPTLDPYASSNAGTGATADHSTVTGNSNVNGAVGTFKQSLNAMDSIKNSPTAQTITQGPMADKARAEANMTKSEFSNLASSRQTPASQTATGQQLTHYHSFFYNLLKWENPRATAISYVVVVLLIVAFRYLPLVPYALKALYILLGVTAAAEILGKMVLGQGFATKIRPRQYYTLPRATVESMVVDMTELVNFFVIEFQRIIYAENVWATVAAFSSTLLTYFLIKVTPAWGLALLFTTLAYFVPLAYLQNQEIIDSHLANAQGIIDRQTSQMRDVAAQQTNKAVGMGQSALKDYSARASEMVGGAKKQAVEKGYVKPETADKIPGGAPSNVKQESFPSAPTETPLTAQQHDGVAEGFPSAPTETPFTAQQHDGTADDLTSAKHEPLAEKEPLVL